MLENVLDQRHASISSQLHFDGIRVSDVTSVIFFPVAASILSGPVGSIGGNRIVDVWRLVVL